MKQKSSLDVAKFICAIMILIIHTNPFGNYSKLLSFGLRNVICVIAVPFFFCTSGYLLSEKLSVLQSVQEQKAYMGKYLKRLAVIYLFWSAVYFPFVLINWIQTGFSFNMVLTYVWDFFFEGSYLTIWFLPALMSAVALYFLLRQKLSAPKVFSIGCGIYVITLLLSSYYGIASRISILSDLVAGYYKVFDSVKNGVLFGLVFVSMGAMVQQKAWFSGISRKKALLGTVLGYGLLCAEVLVYKVIGNTRGIDTVASLLPLTVCAFLFALSFDVAPSKLCLSLRKYSMLIFLCQRLPISIIEFFFSDTVLATNTLVNCATVTAATLLISFVILRLSEKVQWLKKIY